MIACARGGNLCAPGYVGGSSRLNAMHFILRLCPCLRASHLASSYAHTDDHFQSVVSKALSVIVSTAEALESKGEPAHHPRSPHKSLSVLASF